MLGFCGGQLPDDVIIRRADRVQLLDADLNRCVWLSPPRRRSTTSPTSWLILPILGLTETPLPVPEAHLRPRPVASRHDALGRRGVA